MKFRLANMLKALGNPVRFQIMQHLTEMQTCITGEIVEYTTLAQSTVSQHLKVLREAGLIQGEIEGPANLLLRQPGRHSSFLNHKLTGGFQPAAKAETRPRS